MKLAILHLSDIHYTAKKQSSIQKKFDKLSRALETVDKADLLVVAITGDISYSGNASEYALFKIILGDFISKLYERHKDLVVLCVPGNHDVDHSKEKTQLDIKDVYKNNTYEEELKSQRRLLDNYNIFAQEYDSNFKHNELVKSKVICKDNEKIEFLLVDNACFSQLEQNYKGLLFLSEKDMDKINENKDSDFTICLMHHNFDYYNDKIKHKAKKEFLLKSSIVFLGHEHEFEKETIESGDDFSPTEIHMNGSFDGEKSLACLYIVETKNKTIQDYSFLWNNEGGGFYSKADSKKRSIALKRYKDSFLTYRGKYIDSVKKHHKHGNLGQLCDYYVFPRLIEENHSGNDKFCHDIKSLSDFYDILKEKRTIEIMGNSNIGKTSFLYYIFMEKECRNFAKFPLLFSPDDFNKTNPDEILKNKLKKTYNDYSSDTMMYFLQLDAEEKILLIDDYDLAEKDSLNNFLNKYKSSFGFHVYTAHNSLFDFSRIVEESVLEDVQYYRISSFLLDKRNELITKVIDKTSVQNEDLVESISNAFSKNRGILSATPDFLILFCEYYSGTYGVNSSDSSIYSKVFESNLTKTLSSIQTQKTSVDKLMIVLQKIAFFAHMNKKNVITHEEMLNIISDYEEDYLTSFDAEAFISGIIKIQLVIEKDGGYVFADKNIFAYCVANEICSSDDAKQRIEIILSLIQNSCFSINTSILLFIFHILQDTVLLTTTINEALKYVDSWESFSLEPKSESSKFLSINDDLIELKCDEEKIVKEEKEACLKKEAQLEASENKQRLRDIYDNEEDNNIESVNNILLRVCNLMYILARCLPIFEHKLRGDNKKQLASLIYSLPNKIFKYWSVLFETSKEYIIDELKKTWINYHTDEQLFPKEKIDYLLWWESLSLLISLYENSCGVATSNNTKDFLLNYNQLEKGDTLLIQKLVVSSEDSSSPTDFYDIAKKLVNRRDEPAHTIIRRIVLHGILHMSKLDTDKARSLATTYFKKNDATIMKERMKIDNKRKKTSD